MMSCDGIINSDLNMDNDVHCWANLHEEDTLFPRVNHTAYGTGKARYCQVASLRLLEIIIPRFSTAYGSA
ncbi:hypothetical protein B0H34DRAFT_152643 [Crassisporium funariophilum]|nr:hypothetical protein B0H34DRAFT_152643 [Crassisporium funariophilum]